MPKEFKFFKWSGKKAVAFLVLTIALVTAVIGSTLAYVIAFTDVLTNVFTPPDIEVNFNGEGNKITNDGDIDVYVRVAVVPTWMNQGGQMLPHTPEVKINPEDGWVKGNDGFYYRLAPLASGDTTIPLASVTTEETHGSATLYVTVLSEVIQSVPADAVISSWPAITGVNDDGTLVVTPAN